ncbi:hypothetical protein AAU61_10535 [Desulfocarbo indianensis]|nr:hypothetical protein AAU61_10535 [Desulfocarbo indianensis]
MRIVKIKLRNFRCYKDDTEFEIQDLTIFAGRNDSGKSSILDALNIFFKEAEMDPDDASIGGDAKDVRITCEFDDLPEKLILDADYATNLSQEYLVNSSGRLEIIKQYNASIQKPKVTNIYAKAMHPTKDGLSDLLYLKNADLKKRTADKGIDLSDTDKRVNSKIRKLLWDSDPESELGEVLIELEKDEAKKIWAQLKTSLPCYALFKSDRASTDQDDEAQDPMKAAIKEAIKAQEAELDAIAKRVEQNVVAIAELTTKKLKEMHPSLANQLNPKFKTSSWASVFKVSLTGDDEVPINKRGSGVRRLILLNFFRAKAEQMAKEKGLSSVIYAIEEPETSQHPHNQKMLMRAFMDLSESPDCQVLLTTHTPTLARLVPFECIRYIGVCEDGCREIQCGDESTCQTLAKELGILADHDVKLFIGVEGGNDINFLKGISYVLKQAGEDVPDLETLEDDGRIIFVPCGGSNLALWVSRLANLNRPEVHIFDRDTEPPVDAHYQSMADDINARDNCKAFITTKFEIENYIHPDAIKAVRPELALTYGDFDDVPTVVAKTLHQNSGSPKAWEELTEKNQGKKISRAKKWLNLDAVLAMTPDLLDSIDPNGDVRTWLTEIKSHV